MQDHILTSYCSTANPSTEVLVSKASFGETMCSACVDIPSVHFTCLCIDQLEPSLCHPLGCRHHLQLCLVSGFQALHLHDDWISAAGALSIVCAQCCISNMLLCLLANLAGKASAALHWPETTMFCAVHIPLAE